MADSISIADLPGDFGDLYNFFYKLEKRDT